MLALPGRGGVTWEVIDTELDTYGHLCPDASDRTRNAAASLVEQVFGTVADGCREHPRCHGFERVDRESVPARLATLRVVEPVSCCSSVPLATLTANDG